MIGVGRPDEPVGRDPEGGPRPPGTARPSRRRTPAASVPSLRGALAMLTECSSVPVRKRVSSPSIRCQRAIDVRADRPRTGCAGRAGCSRRRSRSSGSSVGGRAWGAMRSRRRRPRRERRIGREPAPARVRPRSGLRGRRLRDHLDRGVGRRFGAGLVAVAGVRPLGLASMRRMVRGEVAAPGSDLLADVARRARRPAGRTVRRRRPALAASSAALAAISRTCGAPAAVGDAVDHRLELGHPVPEARRRPVVPDRAASQASSRRGVSSARRASRLPRSGRPADRNCSTHRCTSLATSPSRHDAGRRR